MTTRAILKWWQQAIVQRIALFLFNAGIPLLVYRLTLIREADMSDPSELALQAYQLGLTHPPGYPVHTLLGHLFTKFFTEPAVATNFMSAVCAALAMGVLSLIIYEVTHNFLASLITPLVLAFSVKVWAMAVVTEVYDVNLLFFALAVYLLILWHRTHALLTLLTAAAIFGLSLGTYLANLLLLPAFLLFLWRSSQNKWPDTAAYLGVISIFGLSILGYTLVLSQRHVPMGVQSLPNTLPTAIQYFSGEQYGTTTLRDLPFYLSRPLPHLQLFSQSFLYVGMVFSLAGLIALWRQQRELAIFTLLIFAINWGYFTFYGPPDYDVMVMPSYLIAALWMGCSLLWLTAWRPAQWAALAVLAGIAAMLLVTQYPQKRARAYSRDVTAFGLWSLSIFPPDAVVVTGWPRYSLLMYYQQTRGLRPDILLIEREAQPRYYDFGLVERYADYIAATLDNRPVIIDINDPTLSPTFNIDSINASWFLVTEK